MSGRERSLFDLVRDHAAIEPEAVALVSELDGNRTYGELTERASALTAALVDQLGVPPGGRVCLWLPNHPAWVETYLAASAAGYSVIGANPEWTDDEIQFALEHVDADLIICDDARGERALDLRASVPSVRDVVIVPDASRVAHPRASGGVAYDDLLRAAGDDVVPASAGSRRPASMILFTSGTNTGRAKAVVGRIKGDSGVDYREMIGLTAADRAMVVTPFFHVNGLGGLTSALRYGASVVFQRKFSARRFWPLVDRYRPTYLFTLAPIVNILLSRPPGPLEHRHSFRVAIVPGVGGRVAAVEERLGIPVVDWYGMTEAVGSGTYTRLDEARKPGSSGQRFPGSTMTIRREDGTEAAPNEVGEVVFERGTIVFDGYLDDDEATRAATDDRYFYTGDLGYFDEDGYFFFVDRKKDIIRRGGENISSIEVEDVLRGAPGVADVVAIGWPDDILGERVVACVVAQPGPRPDPAELRAHAARRLAAFKVPERIVFVDAMPRTPTGKIQKALLRSLVEAADV